MPTTRFGQGPTPRFDSPEPGRARRASHPRRASHVARAVAVAAVCLLASVAPAQEQRDPALPPTQDPLERAQAAVPGLFDVVDGVVRDVQVPVLDALIEDSRRGSLPPEQQDALWIALDVLALRAGPLARYQAQVKVDETAAAAIERAESEGLVELTERLGVWVRSKDHPLRDSARDLLQVKVRCAALAIDDPALFDRAAAIAAEMDSPQDRPRRPLDRFHRAQDADLFAIDQRGALVVASGRSGSLRVSRDGGATWTDARAPTSATLLDVAVGEDAVWAVGAGGAFVRSRDEGETWETLAPPFRRTLLGVSALPDGGVLAVGDYGLVLRSNDGGDIWNCVPQYADVVLNGLTPAPDGAFTFGEFGIIDRLDDEGFGVYPGRLPGALGDTYIFDVWVSDDASLGIAVGLRGLVLRSVDGGHTWLPQRFPYDRDLYAVAGSGDHVTVVGDAGFVAHSGDGGQSFETSDAGATLVPLTDVTQDDPDRVLAVGMRGVILRSEDAGARFVPVDAATASAGETGGGS